MKKKASLKERFSYWFDNKMSSGSLSLIKLLALASVIIVFVIAFFVFVLGLNEGDGFLSAFWNSLATIINAWMPYYEDGGAGYLLLMALASLAGLLITSILIGIIASAIEEKVNSLKRGTSHVLEEDHLVVLGFYPGEYTLLRQLVLAAADQPCCIVVAGDVEQEDMEQCIRENVCIPKNVRIICRTVDIFDPHALERCSISGCRTVIISPTDDFRTTKALLAVSTIINRTDNETVRVGAIVSKSEYRFPPSIAEKHNVTTLQTTETIAKIIAHSCTQPGLSDTFREIFNFEGSELYVETIPGSQGLSFEELTLRLDRSVPIGIAGPEGIRINPPADAVIEEGDQILLFAETKGTAGLVPMPELPETPLLEGYAGDPPRGTVAIIGGNESLLTILQELPDNVSKVILAGSAMQYKDETMRIADDRGNLAVSFFREDISNGGALVSLAGRASHIVVLSDYGKADDDADMDTIFLLLNLRDIRTRFGLEFNITAEMRREANQNLVTTDDNTDFVVASNMSSLILAQLAESPELISAFSEILSNEGSELYLKTAGQLRCAGERTVAELRKIALTQRYIMIGYRKKEDSESHFNPPLHETVELKDRDSLIVIGEQ